MNKTLKILNKTNKINLNQRLIKSQIHEVKNSFKPFNIEIKVKTEQDYFEALIQLVGLKNKQTFEKCFETERHDLLDIWDNLSYQERNKLILLKLDVIKESCQYFKTDENKVIWIPFFDSLLNGLYHNDIAILELPQYFKLYKDFKDRRISIRDYVFLPYTSHFIDTNIIQEKADRIYFYSPIFASIFELTNEFKCTRIPLDKDACKVMPFKKDLLALVNAYQSEDLKTFLTTCIDSTLISDKSKKVFQKRLGKMK